MNCPALRTPPTGRTPVPDRVRWVGVPSPHPGLAGRQMQHERCGALVNEGDVHHRAEAAGGCGDAQRAQRVGEGEVETLAVGGVGGVDE